MSELRYTLLSDGPTDRALIPILTWLLQQHGINYAIQTEWADLTVLHKRPRTLAERILAAVDLYPCDLLFVHRDAEKEPRIKRVREIEHALTSLLSVPPVVGVIPVRMQEAWLLFDEMALRQAAGNPNGKQPLGLPLLNRLEDLPDPKKDLYELLREASGLNGRRRKEVPVGHYATRIPEMVEDFSPLRGLSAFQALEAEIARVVREQGW